MTENYNLFLSHTWSEPRVLKGLLKTLGEIPDFNFFPYFIQKKDLHNSKNVNQLLFDAIKNKMKNCNVVLIAAGFYKKNKKWVDTEILIAEKEFMPSIPIIAVRPWYNSYIYRQVSFSATKIVEMSPDKIHSAIVELTANMKRFNYYNI